MQKISYKTKIKQISGKDNECGIYMMKWHNQPYFYIGKSQNICNRIDTHLSSLKMRCHESSNLQNIYDLHGKPFFEVIEYCEKNMLSYLEIKYLEHYKNDEHFLNKRIPSLFYTNAKYFKIELRVKKEVYDKFKSFQSKGFTVKKVIQLLALQCIEEGDTHAVKFTKDGEKILIPRSIIL